jgi:hypothetical protein
MYHGYRAMLEYFAFDLTTVLVDTEQKLKEAFLDDGDYALTVMICHGWGKMDENAVLNWEIRQAVNEVECETRELHLTPTNVTEYVCRGNGILLSTACWSGKQVWAAAFHQAGFSWYVAPEKTSDMFSAYQFIAAFLGYLMYEERDMSRRLVTVPEATELARRIDDFWDGANGFRAFGSSRP